MVVVKGKWVLPFEICTNFYAFLNIFLFVVKGNQKYMHLNITGLSFKYFFGLLDSLKMILWYFQIAMK